MAHDCIVNKLMDLVAPFNQVITWERPTSLYLQQDTLDNMAARDKAVVTALMHSETEHHI